MPAQSKAANFHASVFSIPTFIMYRSMSCNVIVCQAST